MRPTSPQTVRRRAPARRGSGQPSTPVATADTGKLTSAALRGVGAIWKQGYRYKKAGVIFLDLRPATEVQGTLFDQPDTAARKRLMRALDSLNARYGRDTVTYAASGRRRAWKLRSDQLSPRYTTDWDELLSVR
jgi:DNA polymerase V